jgi:hypothetical protein
MGQLHQVQRRTRSVRLLAAFAVAAATVALVFSLLALRPKTSEGVEGPSFIYLSTAPKVTASQLSSLNAVVVEDLVALDSEFEPGHTWAVMFDPEYLDVLDEGRLGQWYLDGIFLVGIEVDVPTLISAARATPDDGLADIQPPSEIRALLDPTPTDQAEFAVITDGHASWIFRTSQSVLAAGGCALTGAGYVELRKGIFEGILSSYRGVGRGMIEGRDGVLRQSCW